MTVKVLFTEAIGAALGWWPCFLLGAILSATDPVAVVGVLNTLGSPKHLKHAIEGESLLNDGTAVVFFLMAIKMITDDSYTMGQGVVLFFQLAFGGVAWGIAAGWVAFRWCKLSRHASTIDVSVLILCVYLVFYLGEHVFHVSGVLVSVASPSAVAPPPPPPRLIRTRQWAARGVRG